MSKPAQRCIVIGCGGIGSWLTHGLARALNFQAPGSQLILVDGDSFEPKNVERQSFVTQGNKAVALRTDIQPLVRETFILARPAWIVPEGSVAPDAEEDESTRLTAEQLLRENDHVFLAVDNFAARKLVFDAAAKLNTINIYTGGNDDRLFGSVYHYCRRNGEDVTLHPAVLHDEFANPPDRNPGELSCQERSKLEGGTQLLAVNMGVASWLLAKASTVLFGTDEEREMAESQAEIYFDMEVGLAQPYDRRTVQVPAML